MKNAQDDRYLVRVCKDKSGKYFIKRCFNDGTLEMGVKDERWEQLSVWISFESLGSEEYVYSLNREDGILDIDPKKNLFLVFITFSNRKGANDLIDKYDPFNIRDIIFEEDFNGGCDLASDNYECRGLL